MKKVVVIGDAGVGKSTLVDALRIVRVVRDDAQLVHALFGDGAARRASTLGAAYHVVALDASTVVWLWDTAGQERFAPLPHVYLHGATAILLVYDCAAPRIDRLVAHWYRTIVEPQQSADQRLVVVGTRADQTVARRCPEADAFAATIGARSVVVSARSLASLRDVLLPAILDAVGATPPPPPPSIVSACFY